MQEPFSTESVRLAISSGGLFGDIRPAATLVEIEVYAVETS